MLKPRNTPFNSTVDTMPRSPDVPSLESSSIGGYRRCLVRRLLDSGRRLRVRAGHLPSATAACASRWETLTEPTTWMRSWPTPLAISLDPIEPLPHEPQLVLQFLDSRWDGVDFKALVMPPDPPADAAVALLKNPVVFRTNRHE